jgi:hypothetical protein
MITSILLAAIIARGPVVQMKPPITATDSWLCSHASVFFCPIFPKLGEPLPPSQKRVVGPRRAVDTAKP